MLHSFGLRVSETAGIWATAWRMVFKRSLDHWRLLSSVVLGVLLSSAILAGSAIYFDALRELALQNTLDKYSQAELGILGQAQRSPTNRQEFEKVSGAAKQAADVHVDWMLSDRITAGKSPTFFLATPGNEERAREENKRTYFAYLPRLFDSERYATILPGGSFPNGQRLVGPEGQLKIEAAVPVEAARLFGVGVGDEFVAVTSWEDERPSVNVLVSGIFSRNDPQDVTWHLESEVLSGALGPNFQVLPFFISQEAYLDVLGPSFSRMESTYAWLLTVDADRLDSRNSRRALSDLRDMQGDLSSSLSSYIQSTSLDNALQEFDRKLFFSKLPMFVVLILLAVVILYYVVTLSSLVVEERSSEMALMRSRGASTRQIVAVFLLEGATTAVLTIVVAPLIAAVAISALGYTPVFSDLTGGARLSVSISASSYMLSALGGLLSFMAMTIPAVQASRIAVIRQRQEAARPARLPAFQRYYLDLLLLVISIFLFRQLSDRGSVVATNTFGEAAADQILLAVPALVLVASAMVLLRLFPLAMNIVSRLMSSSLPAGLTMGVWQMSRNPVHYARLSLLLILTAGLGIFAASFEATLETSFEERVLHAVGSDVRVERPAPVLGNVQPPRDSSPDRKPGQEVVDAYVEVSGVDRISAVLRSRGVDSAVSSREGNFELLAVDDETFAQVAWFREDYFDKPLDELVDSLDVADPPQGLPLPSEPTIIGARVRPDRLHHTVRVVARLRDSQNQHANIVLGNLNTSGWTLLEAEIQRGARRARPLVPPLSLVSIQVEEASVGRSLRAGSLLIDDIRVQNSSGESWIVEGFNDTTGWNILGSTPEAVSDTLRPSEAVFEDQPGSVLFTWSSGNPLIPRGIFYGGRRAPLPVVANRPFVRATGRSIGDEFDVGVGLDVALLGYRVPVVLVGVVDLFPTVTDFDESLLVANITALDRFANVGTRQTQAFPVELWIKTESAGPDDQQLPERLKEVPGYKSGTVRSSARDMLVIRVDPLVEAGWSALLFIAFAAVLILSCIGFLVHAYVAFRNRQVQFALMRTVGFSLRQLMGMVWLEQLLVIATGMALGTWMGGRLSETIMPFLGHNDFGGRVIPPFALQVNWSALLLTYAAMLLVLALISVGLIWRIHRISLHRVLRLGEM